MNSFTHKKRRFLRKLNTSVMRIQRSLQTMAVWLLPALLMPDAQLMLVALLPVVPMPVQQIFV